MPAEVSPVSGLFLRGVALLRVGVEVQGELLSGALSQGLLQKLARHSALAADETFGFHSGLTVWGNNDFDGPFQFAPPTSTVNLMEPSESCCSVTA